MDLFGRDLVDTQPLSRREWVNITDMLHKNKVVVDYTWIAHHVTV